MYKVPSDIEYGIVRDLRYLPEWARFESKVTLHLKDPSARSDDLEFIVSVDAREDEPFDDLRLRLVLKAARLCRLTQAQAFPRRGDTDFDLAA